jgi:phosphate transport system substrate-binding protein
MHPTAPAFSNKVELKLNEGGQAIAGKLQGFDGKNYVVDTDFLGVVRIDANKVSCLGSACPKSPAVKSLRFDNGILAIRGSNTTGTRLLPALIRDYAAKTGTELKSKDGGNGDVVYDLLRNDGTAELTIDMQRRGSGTAFPALASGEADIGMADRSISDDEIGLLANAGFPQMNRPTHEHVIGLDTIVAITSPKNDVKSLSLTDLSGIFSGEIQDWSELGFPPGRINVYSAPEKSGDFKIFQSLVLKPFGRKLRPDAEIHADHADTEKAVTEDPGGIGFASFAQIKDSRPLAIKDTCGLRHNPSMFGVKSGEYPLARNLYFYTTQLAKKNTAAFVRFATSGDAAAALKESGFTDHAIATEHFDSFRDQIFVSLSAPREDFDLDLMRLLMKTLDQGKRLSATMRFESRSTDLDSESVQQLPDIVDYLMGLDLAKEKIILAGYSDSAGPFDANLELAFERAETVQKALFVISNGELKPETMEVQSFGELFPVGCNDTEPGREKNRRVEIWIVPRNDASPVILSKQE